MTNTTPNKEAIRRVCKLNGASFCYLITSTKETKVAIYSDINEKDISFVESELKNWCGMPFKVLTPTSAKAAVDNIINNGVQILPISNI